MKNLCSSSVNKRLFGAFIILFLFLSYSGSSQDHIEFEKLRTHDRAINDAFGLSLSISGNTLISGAHNNFDENGNDSLVNSGAAYFFDIDSHGNWIETQKIVASDRAANDWFGQQVAIDGDYAIVGAPYEDPIGKSAAGSVYIFERDSNGAWVEKQKIFASDKRENENFGEQISISGNYISVGVLDEDHDETGSNFLSSSGSVYLFERDSTGNWTQKQKIVASDRSPGAYFGSSVAQDGDNLLVGASGESYDQNNSDRKGQAGCVYYFKRNGAGSWIEKQKILTSTRAASQYFGNRISMTDSTFVAASNYTFQSQQGAVFIFQIDNSGQWVENQIIQPLDKKDNHEFGYSTSLSGDVLVVGTPEDWTDTNGNDSLYKAGSIYSFRKNALGVWNQMQKIVPFGRHEKAGFGRVVGVHDEKLVVGAWGEATNDLGLDYLRDAGAIFTFNSGGVFGQIFHDHDYDCIQGAQEKGLGGRFGLITPGNIVVSSNDAGRWKIQTLPVGNYEIKYDTSNVGNYLCSSSQQFSVVNMDSTIKLLPFGISSGNCFQPNVSIAMPIIRRCFSDQLIVVKAENNINASDILPDAYLLLKLDSNIQIESSSHVNSNLGNNVFKFVIGSLAPGESVSIKLKTKVLCSATWSQTLCISAELYPESACMFDTIGSFQTGEVAFCSSIYDNSDLTTKGRCKGDTVTFIVENKGQGNMNCFVPLRVFKNNTMFFQDSVLLSALDSVSYSFLNTGETWRVEVDQHPKYPGKSFPNSTIEACGSTIGWIPGLVNTRSQNDADPNVDVFCGQVTGSYDPNDKTGFPLGVTDTNFVDPNQSMEYLIRFQNTGNDTAFTVVVRDTLQNDFDIFSVKSGASSHSYDFKMYGSRILEWTFSNILLVDSITNEPGSHGFISFKVDQNKNLTEGTKLENRVGIYFDFNDPIITNTTSHVIRAESHKKDVLTSVENKSRVVVAVYPNPVSKTLTIELNQNSTFSVFNLLGMQVEKATPISNLKHLLDVSNYVRGVYFLHVESTTTGVSETIKFIVE
jgi:uncharacterized repeat protein (TIGR01451 family)